VTPFAGARTARVSIWLTVAVALTTVVVAYFVSSLRATVPGRPWRSVGSTRVAAAFQARATWHAITPQFELCSLSWRAAW